MIPEGFSFSQSSLQDYVDCPRRFQLRHLERRRWPAPETADALSYEEHVRRGQSFHRLMRQVYAGIPVQVLSELAATDPSLQRWWSSYIEAPPPALPQGQCEAEVALSTPIRRYRLEARYDLVAGVRAVSPEAVAGVGAQRLMIVDWKTGRRRNARAWLEQRIQTRLYPFVLVQAGAWLNGGRPIVPEQVEMLYWFAEFPAQPEHFPYSTDAMAADGAFLEQLVDEIEARREGVFPKTERRQVCRFCIYRSLCWEDVEAGLMDEAEEVEVEPASWEEVDLDSVVPIPW